MAIVLSTQRVSIYIKISLFWYTIHRGWPGASPNISLYLQRVIRVIGARHPNHMFPNSAQLKGRIKEVQVMKESMKIVDSTPFQHLTKCRGIGNTHGGIHKEMSCYNEMMYFIFYNFPHTALVKAI